MSGMLQPRSRRISRAGRRVYVELSDEPWNFWPSGAYFTAIVLSAQTSGGGNPYYYVIVRTGQIRTIFRTAFGSRANEIYAYLNMQEGNPGTWITPTTSSYTSAGICRGSGRSD